MVKAFVIHVVYEALYDVKETGFETEKKLSNKISQKRFFT